MEYGRYLKEVVQALESDPKFRKKLETAEADDIKVSLILECIYYLLQYCIADCYVVALILAYSAQCFLRTCSSNCKMQYLVF